MIFFLFFSRGLLRTGHHARERERVQEVLLSPRGSLVYGRALAGVVSLLLIGSIDDLKSKGTIYSLTL